MSKFAIIETGGKQYKVAAGERLAVEKLSPMKPGEVFFENVLLVADGDRVEVGTPYLKGAKVEGRVVNEGRGDKKIVFRYHAKTRYRKLKTHRQPYTEVEITKVTN